MLGEDVFEEKDGESFGGDGSGSLNEESHFGETVDDDKNGVKTVGKWELVDEVHGERGPGSIRDGERLEVAISLVANRFRPYAGGACLDVVGNVVGDALPEKVSADELLCLRTSRVTCRWVVVPGLKDSEL